MKLHAWRMTAAGATLALIVLGVAMEMWLIPLRPGGSWLVLKVVPLALCLGGLWRGRRYSFQAMSLLVWLYFTEGIVRATSDRGLGVPLGWIETVLSLILFAACAIYARASAPSRKATTRD